MLKIAYYEENKYHTEIMATFLEPFPNSEIVVYNNRDMSDYVSWYKKFIKYDIKSINEFINDYNLYDIIFIGTSTKFQFFNDIYNINNINKKTKIYLITHLKEELSLFKNCNNIVLTPLNINDFSTFVLPINNLFSNTLKTKNPISIGIIGRFKDTNRNTQDIINLVQSFNHLNFAIKIFTRHEKFIPKAILMLQNNFPDKIQIYYGLSTKKIIDSIHTINYFCPLSSKNSWYHKDRLTGVIPFSLNFNTPLLLDDDTNKIYNLNSAIVYENSLCEIIEHICNMNDNKYIELVESVVEEKINICNNNNITINNIINK